MKNYQVWQVQESDFPENGSLEEKIRFLLNYAVLAPSTFNSQPWLCQVTDDKVVIYLDLSRIPKKSDKTGRFGFVSIGCFIENLVVAASHFGFKTEFKPSVKTFPKKIQVGIVHFSLSQTVKDENLFSAIANRATNRSTSLPKNIPEKTTQHLNNFLTKDQQLIVLDESYQKELAKISFAADMKIWSDKDFREEHVVWVRNNLTRAFDGMPGFGVGIPLIPSFFARPMIMSPIFAKLQAKKNGQAILSSRHFLVLCSKDNRLDWINIGRLYERLTLFLFKEKIVLSPQGQFIEVDDAREELGKLVKTKDLRPQLFLRMGYPSKSVRHSPRRNVEQILIS